MPDQHDPPASVRAHLSREAGLLVDAVRRRPVPSWRRDAPPYGSRADVVRHVAQVMYDASRGADPAAAAAPREVPSVPAHALGDLLAVCAHDLDAFADGVPLEVLAEVLAEVLVHRRDVDGAAPGAAAERAVLAVLGPGSLRCSAGGAAEADA